MLVMPQSPTIDQPKACADPESFIREGPTLTTFFLADDYHYKRAFRWRTDDGPTLNTGLVALRFFQGIRTCIA